MPHTIKEIRQFHTELHKLVNVTKVPDCMVCKCLDTIDEMAINLGLLIGNAEYNMPPPSHEGPCGGPNSCCDGICVDRSYITELIYNAKLVWNEAL